MEGSKRKYRNRGCFVPNCVSGYPGHTKKISLFSAPSCVDLRNEWIKKIPRKDRVLHREDVVCEKHFDPECILRFRMIGETRIDYCYPKLKEGSVPTIFPNCAEYLSEPITTKRPEIERIYLPVIASTSEELTELFAEKNINEDAVYIETINEFNFKSITASNLSLKNWGFHFDENEMAIILTSVKILNGFPVIYRSIVIYENLYAKLFLLKREIQTIIVSSLQDIMDLLSHAKDLEVCYGGPKTENYDPTNWSSLVSDVSEDFQRWRHKQCTFVAEKSREYCKYCQGLFYSFAKRKRKLNKRTAPKRDYFSKNSTPEISAIISLKLKLKYVSRQRDRCKLKINMLREKLQNVQNQCNEISQKTLTSRLEECQSNNQGLLRAKNVYQQLLTTILV